MAYHAGVLRALEVEAGFVPDSADLVIGTSAGSVVGSYLRTGWSTEDFWLLSQGTHPRLAAIGEGDDRRVMTPAFRNAVDLFRRGLGSAYVMSQSVMRLPLGALPAPLRRTFPGGLYSMRDGRRRFSEELGDEWPEKPLWLCAVNIISGRRIVLGRRGAPPCTLGDAVAASCAIPGVYKPVQVGRMTLVDGGAHSTTNLDLAAKDGCDLIIAVAPMAWDTSPSGGVLDPVQLLVRRFPARRLSTEVARARARQVDS
jgi:NTE family protein